MFATGLETLRPFRYQLVFAITLPLIGMPVFSSPIRSWAAEAEGAKRQQDAGDLAGAEPKWRAAVRLAEEELGPSNRQISVLLANLAGVLHLEGKDREAYQASLRASEIAEAL